MRSTKKLTVPESKELRTDKRSRENSKDKSQKKMMNHDIISHFKNTSFNLDKVDMENQMKMLENIVNTFQTHADDENWSCPRPRPPLYTTVEHRDKNPILMTFNQSMVTNRMDEASLLTERGRGYQSPRAEPSSDQNLQTRSHSNSVDFAD